VGMVDFVCLCACIVSHAYCGRQRLGDPSNSRPGAFALLRPLSSRRQRWARWGKGLKFLRCAIGFPNCSVSSLCAQR